MMGSIDQDDSLIRTEEDDPQSTTTFLLPEHHLEFTSSSTGHQMSDFQIDCNNQLHPTPIRKKKRILASCAQCRKRRCACSREFPCRACVAKGEGDQCDWTGASPQFLKPRGQNNRADLIRQESPARLRIKHDFQELDTRVDQLLNVLRRITTSPAVDSKPEIIPVTNYHVDDIATQLSRFTLDQAIPQSPSVGRSQKKAPNSQISVKEVEEYAEEEKRKAEPRFRFDIGSGGFAANKSKSTYDSSALSFGLNQHEILSSSATSPVLNGLLGIGQGPTTFEGIMAQLPSIPQIKACYEEFHYHRSWMHRILHRQTFLKQTYAQIHSNFSYTDQLTQTHWLAILFAVCGLGLFSNTTRTEAVLEKSNLPISVASQRALALNWCRAATSCLQIGNYESTPSIESISAMAILAELPLYTSNGETLGLALDFIGKAIDLAIKLDLHIDPDSHPIHHNATPLVKQTRRRVMIALLSQHYQMGGLLCQDGTLRPFEQFESLELPLDQFDDDFDLTSGQLTEPRYVGSGHTIMTGVRCRFQVARIWQEIGMLFSDPAESPIHETVLDIDQRLKRLESEWPQVIRTEFDPVTERFTPPFALPRATSSMAKEDLMAQEVLVIDRLGCFAVFAAAMVRLHRGFLMEIDGVPYEDTKMHREQVYHYGRALLAIHRTKFFPLDNVPLQFSVLSSTISLAVYCLTKWSSEEDAKCEIVMTELEKIKDVLKKCAVMSSILRRTFVVLDFAVNKWLHINKRAEGLQEQPKKRSRTQPDHESAQEINNPNVIWAQLSKGQESNHAVGIKNPIKGSGNQDSAPNNSQWMEYVCEALAQGHNVDLPSTTPHKNPPSLEPSFGSKPNFGDVPQNFDFTNSFQLNLCQPPPPPPPPSTTTTTSSTASGGPRESPIARRSNGSIGSYLSTPSPSINMMIGPVFGEGELNSSPHSSHFGSSLPFGAGFDHPNPGRSTQELPNPYPPPIFSIPAQHSTPAFKDHPSDAGSLSDQMLAPNRFNLSTSLGFLPATSNS